MNKPSLLLVEDAPMMSRFLTIFLADRYLVTACANPNEALDLIATGYVPDILLTDLNLPDMSGRALVKTLRHLYPYLPIMVISGDKDSGKRLRVLESGADDFMPKPFHPAELKIRLKKLLDRNQVAHSGPKDFFFSLEGSSIGMGNHLN